MTPPEGAKVSCAKPKNATPKVRALPDLKVKKLNDLGSPRPNEGEGLEVREGDACRIESQERLKKRSDGKDKRTL